MEAFRRSTSDPSRMGGEGTPSTRQLHRVALHMCIHCCCRCPLANRGLPAYASRLSSSPRGWDFPNNGPHPHHRWRSHHCSGQPASFSRRVQETPLVFEKSLLLLDRQNIDHSTRVEQCHRATPRPSNRRTESTIALPEVRAARWASRCLREEPRRPSTNSQHPTRPSPTEGVLHGNTASSPGGCALLAARALRSA